MNAADLMLAPGNIFKADIRERPASDKNANTAQHC
jgi:hypothetical protein